MCPMRSRFILLLFLPLPLGASLTTAHAEPPASGWAPVPFSRYEAILSRKPFGLPPLPPPPPPPQAAQPPPPPAFASKLRLCAINCTPAGTVAIGFIDSTSNPPRNYYLDVGETEDGFLVREADFDQEFAVVTKDGVTVTLRLSSAPREVATTGDSSVAAAQRLGGNDDPGELIVSVANARRPGARAAAASKPMFSSATEQLLAMELSVPAGVQSPPLPFISGLEADTHAALGHSIVIETTDSDAVAAHKENVGLAKEELRTHLQAGGDTGSYLQTLKDRRDAEIARQAAARTEAKTLVCELARRMSQPEVEKQLTVVNAILAESGVGPIEAPE